MVFFFYIIFSNNYGHTKRSIYMRQMAATLSWCCHIEYWRWRVYYYVKRKLRAQME